MPTHTLPRHVHTEKQTWDLEALQDWRTSWCLSRLQMPTSGLLIKRTCAHVHMPHSEQSRSDGCRCECSLPENAHWYHSFHLCLSLCHSAAQSRIRSHIHHICWASGAWHTKTHTCTWETPLSPLFKRKTLGFWWLNAPVAPLSPSSWYHTSCSSMGCFQRADHSSLHCGSTIISAGINTKDNVRGYYNWLLSQVSKWQPLHPALSHRPQRGRMEAAAYKPAFKKTALLDALMCRT